MTIRFMAKQTTPPILWELFRYLKDKVLDPSSQSIQGREMESDWYDKNISESYFDHYSKSHYYPIWTVITDRIIRSADQSILDIGCGTGQFASLLNEHGIKDYCGLDFSYKRIEQAKKVATNYHFLVEDAFKTELFEKHQYDSIVCMEVLEHIENDIELLNRIPNGKKFYGTVPNFPTINHVRHFNNPEEVAQRYKEFFKNFNVESYKIGNAIFFIFEGEIINKTNNKK